MGPRAAAAFRDEAGGHRWQRVPPNDKNGRVHTSTITVAVLPEPTEVDVRIAPGDLDWSTCYGTGPGGQKRNKTESTVLLTHRLNLLPMWGDGRLSMILGCVDFG